MRRRKKPLIILSLFAVLILVLVLIYSGLRIAETAVFNSGDDYVPTTTKTIIRDSVAYFPRQDQTVLLVLGIDQYGPAKASLSYNNHGAADMVMLLLFDEREQVCNVLQLNRDTMLEMPVLGIGGKNAGTYFGQLALAHTYGSGLEDSCENTRQAVSDFLYGIYIDYYLSMNMDAISIINDAVGGVTVDVREDFSQVDPSIPMGQTTLMGEQALNYVRTRKDVGDQLNISRIERQKEYIDGFVEAFRKTRSENTEFFIRMYEQVSPYLVSDCSVNTLSSMIDRYGGYEIKEIATPAGENVMGEEYFEFYVDEAELDELILRLFYAPKK